MINLETKGFSDKLSWLLATWTWHQSCNSCILYKICATADHILTSAFKVSPKIYWNMNISKDIGREPQIHRCHWGMTVQWAFVSYRKGSWANASSSMLHSPKRLLKLLKWCKNVYFCHAQPWSHARCYFTHSLKCTKFDFDLTVPPAGFNCFWCFSFIKQKSAWLRLWRLGKNVFSAQKPTRWKTKMTELMC